MYLLGEEKRKVNLGGRSGLSHAAVIDEAKSLRTLRQHQKLQQDGATCLQAWWRAILCRRLVKSQLKAMFEADVLGMNGLRCLALLAEEEMLAKWAATVVSSGEGSLFALAYGPSWLVLIRRVASLLMRSMPTVANPTKEHYSGILNLLLVPANIKRHMGVTSEATLVSITSYLYQREFWPLLSASIRVIPVQSKADPSLPLLVPLATAPFEVYAESSVEYAEAFAALLVHILTLPLLPNRLPLPALTALSAKLPLATVQTEPVVASLGAEDALHLLANLMAFAPARYARLPRSALDAYLRLLSALLLLLPPTALAAAAPRPPPADSDSDDSDAEPAGENAPPIALDARTLKRLGTLPAAAHLAPLLRLAWGTPALLGFVGALAAAWPARRPDVMCALLAAPGAGAAYIAQLYHDHVCRSGIGGAGWAPRGAGADPALPAFVLLLDLYTQALTTMGDDEFFAGTGAASARSAEAEASSAMPNPLSIEELIAFSGQLLRVVWTLYFSPDAEAGGPGEGGGVPPRRQERGAPQDSWLPIRDKAVKCLLAIHARDSRRPFTPAGHWHAYTKLNLAAFIEVAAKEEEQVALALHPLSARELAYFAPRLGILHNVPFAIPFFTRVAIFQRFVAAAREAFRVGQGGGGRRGGRERKRITIRRDRLAQDGFEQLKDVDLRRKVSVEFVDKLGMTEGNAGHRGLYKEFFTAICKEVFDAERGLWASTETHEIYPSPQSHARAPESLAWFRFVGRILGKATFDGILIDFAFAGFFLAKWLGRQGYLDDLASLDPALYRGLIFLKHYAGDVEDLALNFTVDVDDGGTTRTIELLPDGSNMPVTKENRLQYIYLISHFRLSRQIKPQSEAFFEGLSETIEPRWLKMFNQQELQALLGGADSGIDIDDLKAHTDYDGIFKDAEDPTIVAFWNVVNTFDQKERRALLHFVTSCSRAPLMGFKHLQPHFTIQDMGDTDAHLPGSATCSNLLLLPRYKDEAVLKTKLLAAIMSESGF
ncbi:HECT-domain-containing protein [Mycena latifolia]|nr:HECT-domain-containing protein [Mycena latifolia]